MTRPKSELAPSRWEITTDINEESGNTFESRVCGLQKKTLWGEGGGRMDVATDDESNHISEKGSSGGNYSGTKT